MPLNFPVPLYCTNQATPAPPYSADHRRLSATSPGTTDSVLTVLQGNLVATAVFMRPEQALAGSTNDPPPVGGSAAFAWILIPTTEFSADEVRLNAGTFSVPVHYTRNGGLLTANFNMTPAVYVMRLNAAGDTVLQTLGKTTGALDSVTEAERAQTLNVSTAAATFGPGEQLALAVYIQKESAALTEFRLQTNSATGTRVTAAPTYAKVQSTVGSAAGVATAPGLTSIVNGTVGQSSGVAAADGVVALVLATVGQSAGAATADGKVARVQPTVGASAGASTADGKVAQTQAVVGQAAGVAEADGKAAQVQAVVGQSAGISTADGKGGVVVGTVGASAGTSTADGKVAKVVGTVGTATVGEGGGETIIVKKIIRRFNYPTDD